MAYTNRTSYEGQWIARKRNGKGTYYWIYSVYNVIYNGEWKNDLQNGFGNESYLYSCYEGQWKDQVKDQEMELTLIMTIQNMLEN